jgi:serine/threonine protein kinase
MTAPWTCRNGHTCTSPVCPECGATRDYPAEACSAPTVPPTLPGGMPSTGGQPTIGLAMTEESSALAGAVPGYEILAEIARGGMGVVYKARHLRLKHRVVALKMILGGAHAGKEERQRFLDEAQAVARLHHDNIVQIYDVDEVEGRPYLAMEYVNGGSLAALLARGPLPPRDAACLVATLARAMEHAHGKGIIHRDLKPANVLLARPQASEGRGQGGQSGDTGPHRPAEAFIPKIADFGLAKNLEEEGRTLEGAIMGTPSYMAPEQARGQTGELTPAIDVYALGVILYECITGRPPFVADSALDIILQVTNDEPSPPRKMQPRCPRNLETICLKCLEKSPRKRYESAKALAEDLERYLEGEPILARPINLLGRFTRWCARQPDYATALIALTLFYVNHLVLMMVGIEGEDGAFHTFVTALVCGWLAGATLFHRLGRRAGWGGIATFAWCGLDVVCLSLFLWGAHGPRSALASFYLLLIPSAALRGSIALVWFVTGLAMVGYLTVLLEAHFYRPELAISTHRVFIFMLSLGMMGLLCHLLVRRIRMSGGGPTLHA